MVKDRNDKPTYVAGYLTMPIHPSNEKTFYTRYGDVFAVLCVVITLGLVCISFIAGRLRSKPSV
jgi:apolipoprotein N-acyltransferase